MRSLSKLNFTTLFAVVFLLFFYGCSKDDGPGENGNIEINADLLVGTWAIFQGELDGQTVNIPVTNPNCGRDFFVIKSDGTYMDFLVSENSDCVPITTDLNWSLRNNIFTVGNSFGENQELEILELTSSVFVFKTLIDFDEDGSLDEFTFTARPYIPRDFDNISFTFQQNFEARNRIEFTWQAYAGVNEFDRYEIYRTSTNCNKSEAVLAGTITDQQTSVFIDESPEAVEELCYYLKIYTSQGELGESELVTIFTNDIEVPLVNIITESANNDQIDLQWLAYEGYYFSHYEVNVRNYEDGTSGYAYQEVLVAQIDDQTVTSFSDTNPPYVRNPVYEVKAVNIFGNKTSQFAVGGIEVNYQRPGLLDLSSSRTLTYDPNEPTLYFLGIIGNGNDFTIMKHNYSTNESIISNDPPNTSSDVFMKVIDSDYGKELLLLDGSDIYVYDANDLNLKYRLVRNEGFIFINDFDYMGNGIWAITDSDKLYTFSRDNAVITSISETDLTFNTQNAGNFQILPLNGSKVLVGHEFDSESYTLNIESDGQITNKTTILSVNWKDFKKTLFYNSAADIILDNAERGIYETQNFSFSIFYDRPFLATGLSTDGSTVLGTDNDPEWTIDEISMHERKAVFFDINTAVSIDRNTIGYPLLVFENNLGQRVSISSWFKREDIARSNPKPDLFVEILD